MIGFVISYYLLLLGVVFFAILFISSTALLFINKEKARRGFKVIGIFLVIPMVYLGLAFLDDGIGGLSISSIPQIVLQVLTGAGTPILLLLITLQGIGIHIPFSLVLSSVLTVIMYVFIFKYVFKKDIEVPTTSTLNSIPLTPVSSAGIPPVVTIVQVPPIQSPSTPTSPVTQ